MSTLRSRYGLQGLERQGVYLADQPGLVYKGKSLNFFALDAKPEGPDALGPLLGRFKAAVDDARELQGLPDLHLYYLDADGHALVSTVSSPKRAPELDMGGGPRLSQPVPQLVLSRRFEATGRTGVRFRVFEEHRDPFSALEKYLTAFQLGWGGLFFARDAESRTKLFRHFDPLKSGVFRVEEKLVGLSLQINLVLEGGIDGLTPYRVVRTALDEATLEEALAWS